MSKEKEYQVTIEANVAWTTYITANDDIEAEQQALQAFESEVDAILSKPIVNVEDFEDGE